MKQEGPEWYTSHTLPRFPTVRDYVLFPFLALKCYLMRLERVFGFRFLVYLGVIQVLLKGAAATLADAALLPLFKNVYGVPADSLQLYSAAVLVPWSLKPVMGLLSDFLVIGGYHKRYWLFAAGLGGITGAACLFGALEVGSVAWFVICFTMVAFQVALFDLMSESTYAGIMNRNKFTGSDLVTLVQCYEAVGSIVVVAFVGVLSDAGAYRVSFAMILFLTIVPMPLTWLNWIGEERTTESRPPLQREELYRIGVIGFTGLCAPAVAVLSNVADPVYATVLAILAASFALLGSFWVFPRTLALLATYQVVTAFSYPSLGSALDYFYTAGPTCLPNGPNFSFAYYQTLVGVVGILTSILGVVVYQHWLGSMRYRRVLWITAGLRSFAGLSDLFMTLRWNLALGLSDRVAYLLGEAIMEPVLVRLGSIVAVTLISRSVMEGMESSTYAFMAGITNFSWIGSRLVGALIYDAAGVRTTEPGCNFDALWWLVLVFNIVLPMVVGAFSAFLVPDVYQTESLLHASAAQPAEEEQVWLERVVSDEEE